MGSAAANRQAMWNREKTERANNPRPDKPQGYTPPPKRVYNLRASASWAVCKVYEDGRPPIAVKALLTVEQAEQAAMRMNDAATEDEVARMLDEEWSYRSIRIKGAGARAVANPEDTTYKFVNRGPGETP